MRERPPERSAEPLLSYFITAPTRFRCRFRPNSTSHVECVLPRKRVEYRALGCASPAVSSAPTRSQRVSHPRGAAGAGGSAAAAACPVAEGGSTDRVRRRRPFRRRGRSRGPRVRRELPRRPIGSTDIPDACRPIALTHKRNATIDSKQTQRRAADGWKAGMEWMAKPAGSGTYCAEQPLG